MSDAEDTHMVLVDFFGQPPLHLLIVALAIFGFAHLLKRLHRVEAFPRIGKKPSWLFGSIGARTDFCHHGHARLAEGLRKYSDSPFIVQTADTERIIVPPKYVTEIRSYPSNVANSQDAFQERYLGRWNTLDSIQGSSLHVDVLRKQLHRNLDDMIPDLAEQARVGWMQELSPLSEDSKGSRIVPACKITNRVLARLIGRAMVGESMCRNAEMHQVMVDYGECAFRVADTLRPWPPLLRYVISPFMRSRMRLRRIISRAEAVLTPLIDAHRQPESDYCDITKWLIAHAKGEDRSSNQIVLRLLFLSVASVTVTTMGVIQAMYDLCAHPEHAERLREEIETVLEQQGGWNAQALQKMEFLDSFLRESQRLNPPGLFACSRKIHKDMLLSDGSKIPAGSMISIPTFAVHLNSEIYPDPLRFDPFRSQKLRQQDTANAQEYLLTSVNSQNLVWGCGAFACPGRFLAVGVMKIVIGELLLNYRIEFPDGQSERPANLYNNERIAPNRSQKIVFTLQHGSQSY